MSVSVGSDSNVAIYKLSVALLCYHSQLIQQELSRYQTKRTELYSNKKRKHSHEDETTIGQIKVEESDRPAEPLSSNDSPYDISEPMVKLPDVDPYIFGLFLKYVFTGYYAATVDARPGKAPSYPHMTKSTQSEKSYSPARASMPPPASIASQPASTTMPLPDVPLFASNTSAFSLQQSSLHFPIPPSVHAYLLSVQLGAPGFLNQAINHIYYGIGKHFFLSPSLVHYIWSNTLPHPFCSSAPLRKLVLDVMAVHWSSTSTKIIAKQPTLHKLWNEVLDIHRDLRHEFTTGLQGARKVLPVQEYLVSTRVPYVLARKETKDYPAKESEVQVARNTQEKQTTADAAVTVATVVKIQDNSKGEERKN